ncbi:unnamed protein product, partial [marine sediment metagenome]
AFASLYWLYVQEKNEQTELNAALAATQATLPKLAEQRASLESTLTELEDRLAQVTSQLKTAKAVFPALVESIEVDELLFGFADTWDLEITSLTASEPRDYRVKVEVEDEDIEVEDITYLVTTFTVDVEGKAPESDFKTEEEYKAYIDKAVDDILNFIHTVVTHRDFDTATVELVNIVVPEPLSEKEKEGLTEELIEEREGIEVPSATINLVIYSYKGE